MGAERPTLVAVTALPGADGGSPTAAAVGVALARGAEGQLAGVIVLDASGGSRQRPTLVSSTAARALEATLAADIPAAARGALCAARVDQAELPSAVELCCDAGAEGVVVHAPPAEWRNLVDGGYTSGAVLRADPGSARPLTAIAARELISAGIPTGVVTRSPGLVASRRALAGIEPGGELGTRARRFAERIRRSQSGQATPITMFFALAVVVAGVLVAILGAAATGAARYQRTADLAAVSAARSMRDDHHRLFLPPTLPSGLPNPAHLSDADYRARAAQAATEAVERNGAEAASVDVDFPGAHFAPTRVRVELEGAPEVGAQRVGTSLGAVATAEAYPVPASSGEELNAARGGGYSGPLVTRQGEGMRPDVARAFDAMAAAAAASGHSLLVNSGFRSDAEQAALFAANPDPRMVARPGTSLHRCATELDLGPPSAYGWLSVNARRFGFLQRYSWEAWHYGFVDGPPPCSETANQLRATGSDGKRSATGLPTFVPERFREPIARAASRWGVPGNVLAAQLLAESNFNPLAISPAGASGIAQFMPATAAAYGLQNPFDPAAAIDAQARLMSDLLRRFGEVPLALAAYNAGPAPVSACSCVPPYAETQAYVARILGLLGGVGALAPPTLEVRLVGQ